MTDYIKREDAVKALLDEFDGDIRYTMTIDEFVSNATRIIKSVPTADAVPVVHGHWIAEDDGFWCSSCKAYANWQRYNFWHANWQRYNFCPNCGAKMDEVSE